MNSEAKLILLYQLKNRNTMKKIFFLLLVLFTTGTITNAQAQEKKSRKEIRAERQAEKKKEIKNILNEKNFVFRPTHAMPMGGGTIYLNYSFDVKIKGDTIDSYLPFYGRAYHVDYGGRNSAFDFTEPAEEYKMEKDEDGYVVDFEVKKGMDHISFSFKISELGYATLNVISTNRQAISFYGRIEPPEDE
jgi:hypothetical protein